MDDTVVKALIQRKCSTKYHVPRRMLMPDVMLQISLRSRHLMMCPYAKFEKVYLYPKSVEWGKSIDGLTVLVELDIKVAVFDQMLFVFFDKP